MPGPSTLKSKLTGMRCRSRTSLVRTVLRVQLRRQVAIGRGGQGASYAMGASTLRVEFIGYPDPCIQTDKCPHVYVQMHMEHYTT